MKVLEEEDLPICTSGEDPRLGRMEGDCHDPNILDHLMPSQHLHRDYEGVAHQITAIM